MFFVTILVSCESLPTEENVSKQVSEYSIDNGLLKISNFDVYDNLIENSSGIDRERLINTIARNKHFKSLGAIYYSRNSNKRTFSDPEEEFIENNDFITSILNHNSMIAIGDYVFKISLEKEKVYVLPVDNINDIDDLANEDLNNPNILVYSTGDDVLQLLSESNYSDNSRVQLFCSESSADRDKDDDFDYSPFNNSYRQDNKIVYQKAGIYFSLQSKTKMQYKGWTGLWGAANPTNDQSISYYVKYDPKCKSTTEKTGVKNDDGGSYEFNYRPYESSRGLRAYRFEVTFSGGGFFSRSYEIYDKF